MTRLRQTSPFGSLMLARHGAVGIDAVAGMDEEIRAVVAHGAERAHAAARHVDAPALSRDIAGPGERHEAATAGAVRKRPTWLSPMMVGGQVLEADAVEDVLAGRQVFEQHLGREIALRQRVARRRVEMVSKLSLVEASTSMRAGRSARAHTMPESTETSPDWMPCVISGRSAARLRRGFASEATARLEVERTRNCRRVHAREARSVAIQETFVESRRKVPAPFDCRLTVS